MAERERGATRRAVPTDKPNNIMCLCMCESLYIYIYLYHLERNKKEIKHIHSKRRGGEAEEEEKVVPEKCISNL